MKISYDDEKYNSNVDQHIYKEGKINKYNVYHLI